MFYFRDKPPREALLMTRDFVVGDGSLWDDAEGFNAMAIDVTLRSFYELEPGLRHLSLPSLTWGRSIRRHCGFEREGFFKLFALLLPTLHG